MYLSVKKKINSSKFFSFFNFSFGNYIYTQTVFSQNNLDLSKKEIINQQNFGNSDLFIADIYATQHPDLNFFFSSADFTTDDVEILLFVYSKALTLPALFDWFFLCVTVIPISLIIYIIVKLIKSSFLSKKYALEILSKNKENLTNDELNISKDEFNYNLTILNLRKTSKFLFILLCLQIINPMNWTQHLLLYGGFFISTPNISFMVCLVLFISWIGIKLIIDLTLRLKISSPDLSIVLLFLIFFLLLMIYSNHLLPLYFGIEGTALATCLSLVVFYKTNSLPPVINYNNKLSTYKYSQLLINWKITTKNNQEAIAAGMLYFLLNFFITIILGFLFFF